MDTKVCYKCKKPQPLSYYHKKSQAKDGLYHICKYCKNTHKYNLAVDLFEKGLKICDTCNTTKKLSEFAFRRCNTIVNKNRAKYTSCCKQCAYNKNNKKIKENRLLKNDSYYRNRAMSFLRRHNIEINEELIEIQMLNFKIKDKGIITFDGIEFTSLRKLATHIKNNHSSPYAEATIRDHLSNGRSISSLLTVQYNYKITFLDSKKEFKKVFLKECVRETGISKQTLKKALLKDGIVIPYKSSKQKSIIKIEKL